MTGEPTAECTREEGDASTARALRKSKASRVMLTCVDPEARIDAAEGTAVNARHPVLSASSAAKNREARAIAGEEERR